MTTNPMPPRHSAGFGLSGILLILAMAGILAAICLTSMTKVSRISTATGYLIERTEPLDEDCVRQVEKIDQTAFVL